MKCPRCEQDNPVPDAQFCPRCGAPTEQAAQGAAPTVPYSDLQCELTEARDQQTATSEILRVISRSPTDVQPVFDTIIRSAVRLLGGFSGLVTQIIGDQVHLAALTSTNPSGDAAQKALWPRPVKEDVSVHGQVITSLAPSFITDVESDRSVPPSEVAVARARGWRSIVAVPLLRDGRAIGSLAVTRSAPGAFADGQIALLQTFANQAVIAIENVRLLTELEAGNHDLTRALDRETATSEILRVISSSPTDVQPVFDAIVRSAVTLCGAILGAIYRHDGGLVSLVGLDPRYPQAEEVRAAYPAPVTSTLISCRAIHENAIIQLPDTETPGVLPAEGLRLARLSGFRSVVAVPMRREGEPIGAILVGRPAVGAFPDEQIGLLQTFADQAVIAIENARLFTELQRKNLALTEAHAQVSEALDQQTATAEILRVISRAQTDVQPVFEAIADTAMRLLGAWAVAVGQYDGELLSMAAARGGLPGSADAATDRFQRPHRPAFAPEEAVLTKRVHHVADIETDPSCSVEFRRHAAERGSRSFVAVPMLRGGDPIGLITVSRAKPGAFSTEEIALLQTFADQAVIAIENVRLFRELEARNTDLTESLEQQTATSEILRVISSSPTDVQPVFEAIVQSAERLCSGQFSVLCLFDGELVHFVAHHNLGPEALAEAQRIWPTRPARTSGAGRAILERRVVQIRDIETDLEYGHRQLSRAVGHRSSIYVPMLKDGAPVGVIVVARVEPGQFADNQVALLQTFADQAVIAIENVRLFKELQEKNRSLTEAHAQVSEALERQTATADILRVISQSQAEVQPVFDAIVDNAMRLFRSWATGILRLDGQLLHLIAARGGMPGSEEHLRAQSPWPVHGTTAPARCVAERTVIHIPDTESDPALDQAMRDLARSRGWRSTLCAPMLRDGQPIGAISVTRREAGAFSPAEIALLQTFADQAVIAVENARLLTELQARTQELTRSVGQLTALGEVSRALSSTLDLDRVLQTIVTRASQLAGTDACSVFEYDEATETFHLRATNNLEEEVVTLARQTPIRKGEGVQGRMAVTREPVQVPDIAAEDAYRGPLRDILLRTGTRAVLAVPMLRENEFIGGLTVNKRTPGEFSPEVIELLKTFATQSALAIQNARLFQEIADKSAQLEAASRHKSEFLANMSHELRTPLNAIIGFSEVLSDRMFGELNDKQEEYLKDIYASGQHLLSLINDILDLSKIEAGRMELEVSDFDLPAAIDNALILVRERASRHGIRLGSAIDDRVGMIRGDERKVKQVLLNLLSNALKFTPEGGRIDVRAAMNDGMAEISVADTGVGIAPEDQEAIFEEFRQVGTADKKVEGTGLGLALSRKFIELHGGRIWVHSQPGKGSTFSFTLPESWTGSESVP